MVFGLELILALMFGVASMALARDGQSFVLGARNVASSRSTLVKQRARQALQLQVGSGQPPLKFNATAGAATNLKAADSNKLDGKDSTGFVEARGDINGNTVDSFSGIVEHSEGS